MYYKIKYTYTHEGSLGTASTHGYLQNLESPGNGCKHSK